MMILGKGEPMILKVNMGPDPRGYCHRRLGAVSVLLLVDGRAQKLRFGWRVLRSCRMILHGRPQTIVFFFVAEEKSQKNLRFILIPNGLGKYLSATKSFQERPVSTVQRSEAEPPTKKFLDEGGRTHDGTRQSTNKKIFPSHQKFWDDQ